MADKQLSEVLKSETRKLMRELSTLRKEVSELTTEVQRLQDAKPERMYRRKDAALELGVSIDKLKLLLSSGKVECVKEDPRRPKSAVLIPASAIAKYQHEIKANRHV